MLAVSVFDTSTGALTVDFEASDTTVTIGNRGNLLTINNQADLDRSADGMQSVALDQITRMTINGAAVSAVSSQGLTLRGEFTAATAPLLTDFHAGNLTQIEFAGQLELSGDLSLNLTTAMHPDSGQIMQTAGSEISVAGQTSIRAANGDIDLARGTNDFGGPLSVVSNSPGQRVQIQDVNHLQLQHVEVTGSVRAFAASISDVANSVIDVQSGLWLKAGEIHLGDNAGDEVVPRMLNFKATGSVDISVAGDLWLIGSSYAESARLTSTGGVFDSVHARTSVDGMLSVRADRLELGDRPADLLNAGSIHFQVSGPAHVSENSSLLLAGASQASSLTLTATAGITDAPDSRLEVTGHAHFQAGGDIVLGEQDTDWVNLGTVRISNPGGLAQIHSDGDLQLAGISHVHQLHLQAAGDISDQDSAHTTVVRSGMFVAGGGIRLGDSSADQFDTGDLTFRANQSVSIEEDSNTFLSGENRAANLHLVSAGFIANRDAINLQVTGDARFSGEHIKLGVAKYDLLRAGRFNFNAARQVTILADGDIQVFGNNQARGLILQATSGMVSDAEGTVISIRNHTLLTGDRIRLGMAGTFTSGSLSLWATGNVTLQETGDMLLADYNVANSFRLRATGQIANAPGTTLQAMHRLDLAAESADLGRLAGDDFRFSSLRFNTSQQLALMTPGNVLMVLDSHAGSLDLMAYGGIHDQLDSRIVVEQFANLTGTNIILGDSDNDCFMVPTGSLQVNASGIQRVSVGC